MDKLIRLALNHRPLVIALAALVVAYGAWVLHELPIDVFPDLNRPVVTILTECDGMAPEEVEALVALGATYIQFDEVIQAYLCDDGIRDWVRSRGEDPDEVFAEIEDEEARFGPVPPASGAASAAAQTEQDDDDTEDPDDADEAAAEGQGA